MTSITLYSIKLTATIVLLVADRYLQWSRNSSYMYIWRSLIVDKFNHKIPEKYSVIQLKI